MGGFAHEVEVEVGGNGQRHGAELGEYGDVEGEVGERHHGGAGDGAAGADVALVIEHAHARCHRRDFLDDEAAPAEMDLGEFLV